MFRPLSNARLGLSNTWISSKTFRIKVKMFSTVLSAKIIFTGRANLWLGLIDMLLKEKIKQLKISKIIWNLVNF